MKNSDVSRRLVLVSHIHNQVSVFSIFDVHFCNKSLESHLFTVYFNLLSDYLAIGCILCWT